MLSYLGHLRLELVTDRLQIGSGGNRSCSLAETESLRTDCLATRLQSPFLGELDIY